MRASSSCAIALAVAKRYSLPLQFVANVLNSTVEEMQERDRYLADSNGSQPVTDFPRHALYMPKLQYWQSDPRNSYVDYIDVVNPLDVIPSEPECGIRNSPIFSMYVSWYKEGHLPPYPSVFEQIYDGQRKLLGANRRRILAAQEAGISSLPVWLGRWNKETGLPLKYGDILDAAGA